MKQLSVSEARNILPISSITIKNYMLRGEIKGYVGTHRLLVDEESFMNFVERHTSYEDPKFLEEFYQKNPGKKIEITLPGGVDKWISIKDVQEIIPLSFTAVRNLIKDKKITACLLDNRVFIKQSSFLRHMAINVTEVDQRYNVSDNEAAEQEKKHLQEVIDNVSVIKACDENGSCGGSVISISNEDEEEQEIINSEDYDEYHEVVDERGE